MNLAATTNPWARLRRDPRQWLVWLSLLLALLLTVLFMIISAGYRPMRAVEWLFLLVAPAYVTVGTVILLRRPGNRIGRLCLIIGWLQLPFGLAREAAFGLLPDSGAAEALYLRAILTLGQILCVLIFVYLPLLFPDGRYLNGRWQRFGRSFAVLTAVPTLLLLIKAGPMADWAEGELVSPYSNPLAVGWPWLDGISAVTLTYAWGVPCILAFFVAVGSLLLRFRRSGRTTRQQIKWVVYFLATFVGLFMLTELSLWLGVRALLPDALHGVLDAVYEILGAVAWIGLPLIIGLAVLKYRLYDIDIIINRTLVYGALSLGVVAVYVLIVGALGTLLQAQGNLLLALLATGLIAVLFQPVRARLQQAVNRLMFGERDDPYAVLSRLGRQLQDTISPDQTLSAITATICQALKLPYATIIVQTAEGGRRTVAASGRWEPILQEWPLRYQGQLIGWLAVAPRSPGEQFSRREMQLLGDIAAQAGAAAQAAQLTGNLQKAREKLVLAREEERRRIRRDLHDGLGPTVASQTFALDAAIELLDNDPAAAEKLLRALKGQNQELVAEIRRLVYELRPGTLDELGLAEALTVHVQQLDSRHPTQISLVARPETLANLPAAVEVAAYRLVQEAINNVLRHAQASRCLIEFSRADGRLTASISDDGCGIDPDAVEGVGMRSMRERAEELGGTFVVAPREPVGTKITAVLPTGDHYEQIRPALPEELPLVMEIIAEAAAWLQRKGIDQWPSPPNRHWWRRAAAHIEKGEVYLAFRDGKSVATLRLIWSDMYWPDDGCAGYVLSLAIRDSAHGLGLGKALLDWAAGQVRSRGRTHLRLDAPAANQRLRRYYEAQGFSFQGEVEYLDYRGALFEKAL